MDPDQLASQKPADLELHCFQNRIYMGGYVVSLFIAACIVCRSLVFDYSLHNQTLKNIESAKYLGITISDNMVRVNTFQKFLPKQLRHSFSIP